MSKSEEEKYIQSLYSDLLASCPRKLNDEDKSLVDKAFNLAKDAHKGIKRKSGEPYILHPISVAIIAAQEIGLGPTSIACALIHDVVEDSDYTHDDIKHIFGDKIAVIIQGLTKISDVFDKESSLQIENFKKILLALSDDVRVILIKLADRLHNMRTLEAMPLNKQLKIAGETIYLYAPLAHRLGLHTIKTELENLSIKYRHPKDYEEISKKIQGNRKKRQNEINKFFLPIIQKLENNNFEFDISGRPKSIYSTWQKMQKKNISFEEVYDLLAVRIVFKSDSIEKERVQCWQIYSLITEEYMPKPERIRDWISTPKPNGYEALHVTVMGPEGKWVEVQIRSERMNEIAERGFAAHWKYKGESYQENEYDKWIKKIRETLEDSNSEALEFFNNFKLNIFSSEIMVFTPKGKLINLPKGAIALDFAYEIHSEIGAKAIGAKVNHKLVPLSYVLSSGDQIEIITSSKNRIQREWFDTVITAKARSSIIKGIKFETKNRKEKGRKLLEEKLKECKLSPSARVFRKILPAYKVKSKDELYSKIGSGFIDLSDLKKIIKKNTRNKLIKYWGVQVKKNQRKVPIKADTKRKINYKRQFVISDYEGDENTNYKIAKCCNPIPGDAVVGYKSPEQENVIIHKASCTEAIKLMASDGNHMLSVKWKSHQILSFLSELKIDGIDRMGVINDITNIISEVLSVNMRKIHIETHDGIFEGFIELYVHSVADLNNLIMNIGKIKGVNLVKRVKK
ncbi:MAG: RelA/SpoT family protein [Bacteroidota bacterium]|nr:RelA/SpoT family protein [Bacteroidota bacterium]